MRSTNRLSAKVQLAQATRLMLCLGLAWAFSLTSHPKLALADEAPSFEQIDKMLTSGQLDAAERKLVVWLENHPEDHSRRLGLGVVQLMLGYQQTFEELNKYGARFQIQNADLLAAERPANAPLVTYKTTRKLVRNFRNRIAKAQQTIALAAKPDAKLPLHFAAIKLDLNGNGKIDKNESIAALMKYGRSSAKHEEIMFVLDRTDALWIEAQCHAMLASCNFLLAHDWSEMFQYIGHTMFWNTGDPWNDKLGKWKGSNGMQDGLATLHLLKWPLHNKKRMLDSLEHWELFSDKVLAALESLEEETDDDRELLAGPQQKSQLKAFQILKTDLAKMRQIAEHFAKLLKGEVLAPTLRDAITFGFNGKTVVKEGINVRKFFTEPRDFDFVLLLHGSAAKPFLEKGPVDMDLWRSVFSTDWVGQLRLFGIP